MKLLKSSIWSFLTVLVRGISSLGVNKLIAMQYGPGGIAIFAHFQNLFTMLTTIPNDGINRGLIRYLSQRNADKKIIFSTGFWINVIVSIISFGIILIFQDNVFKVFNSSQNIAWTAVFFISTFLILLNYYILSILLAYKQLKQFFILELIASVLFFGVVFFGLKQNLLLDKLLLYYIFGLSTGFVVFAGFFIFKIEYYPIFSFRMRFSPSVWHLTKFVIMAFTALIFERLVDFAVRQYSINTYGEIETGLWQGLVKISDYYMMAFTSVLMMSYFPRVSGSIHSERALRLNLMQAAKLYLPMIFGGVLAVYFLRNFLLNLLLDKSFTESADLIKYQLIGDTIRMTGFLLSLILMAQARLGLFIFGEFLTAVVYLGAIYFIPKEWGTLSFLVAHIGRFAIYFIFLLTLFKSLLVKR